MWLIGTDLDGTLVRPDGTVSERTRRALRARADAGDHILFLTGRSPWDSTRGLPLDALTEGVMICANGAVTYDPLNERVRHVDSIDPVTLAHLATACREQYPGGWFCADGIGGVVIDEGHPWTGEMGRRARSVPDMLDLAGQADFEPFKVTYLHPELPADAMIDTMRALLADHVSLTYGSVQTPQFLEFASLGVSKGHALARVADSLGIPAARIACFGDMPNDISMFDVAGHSFAMGNAPAIVQGAARDQAASAEADGVAVVLEELDRLCDARDVLEVTPSH